MAIFELFEEEQEEQGFTETFDPSDSGEKKEGSGHLFSTLMTRGCFFLLLLGSALWIAYSLLLFACSTLGYALTLGKVSLFAKGVKKFWLTLRRALVCTLSLFLGLFCPPFGIMVACTYFLMYDKAGMDEVVPASFQAQMKEIFPKNG